MWKKRLRLLENIGAFNNREMSKNVDFASTVAEMNQ